MIIKRSINSTVLVALLGGVGAIISINNISRLLGIWQGSGAFIVALISFFVVGSLIELCSPLNTSKALILLLSAGAVVIGVIIDATLDFFLRKYDRNLFPLEIVMWWIFAPLPLLAGITTVRTARRRRNRLAR